jgi:hypothetical protein
MENLRDLREPVQMGQKDFPSYPNDLVSYPNLQLKQPDLVQSIHWFVIPE